MSQFWVRLHNLEILRCEFKLLLINLEVLKETNNLLTERNIVKIRQKGEGKYLLKRLHPDIEIFKQTHTLQEFPKRSSL